MMAREPCATSFVDDQGAPTVIFARPKMRNFIDPSHAQSRKGSSNTRSGSGNQQAHINKTAPKPFRIAVAAEIRLTHAIHAVYSIHYGWKTILSRN